jgi:hypothetical protein
MNIDANIMIGFQSGMKVGFACGLLVGVCFFLKFIYDEKQSKKGKS